MSLDAADPAGLRVCRHDTARRSARPIRCLRLSPLIGIFVVLSETGIHRALQGSLFRRARRSIVAMCDQLGLHLHRAGSRRACFSARCSSIFGFASLRSTPRQTPWCGPRLALGLAPGCSCSPTSRSRCRRDTYLERFADDVGVRPDDRALHVRRDVLGSRCASRSTTAASSSRKPTGASKSSPNSTS